MKTINNYNPFKFLPLFLSGVTTTLVYTIFSSFLTPGWDWILGALEIFFSFPIAMAHLIFLGVPLLEALSKIKPLNFFTTVFTAAICGATPFYLLFVFTEPWSVVLTWEPFVDIFLVGFFLGFCSGVVYWFSYIYFTSDDTVE